MYRSKVFVNYPEENSVSLLGGGGRLTFSAFRMGGHSRWALIRDWALIQINTVASK